jgi:hypothetical protein
MGTNQLEESNRNGDQRSFPMLFMQTLWKPGVRDFRIVAA